MLMKKKKSVNIPPFLVTLFLILSVCAFSFFSSKVSEFVKDGLKLCYSAIIGSVFPFVIITDILCAEAEFDKLPLASRLFERLFKINGYAISAFITGILCGFPIGVKVAADLYKRGIISKNECERLISFSNNTGPAFLIAGVGAGMRASSKDGIILYASMVISSVLVGIALGIGNKPGTSQKPPKKSDFNIVSSVRNAAENTLYICAFIVLFSVVVGFFSIVIKNDIIYTHLVPFIEIGNAAKTLAKSSALSGKASLIMSSFAVSFSGISVHLQAKSFLEGTDISMKLHFFAKFSQGLVSALITAILI